MGEYNARLKTAIKESGRLQWWVAEQAGVTSFAMSQIVNGKQDPSTDQRRAIAKVLQVKQSVIFS